MSRSGSPVVVLMAEDNPDDVELTRAALADAKVRLRLHVVNDGLEALKFLCKEPPYEESPTPNIILLDLNMPRMDGREALKRIKADESFRAIPVVVLTTSAAEEDVLTAYRHNVNCYIRKPVDFEQFVRVVQSIEDFWFTIVELPNPS